MSVFLQKIKRLGTRIIVHSPAAKLSQESKPVKLAFEIYENTENLGNEGTIPPAPLLVAHGFLGSKSNWNTTCLALQKVMKPPRKIISIDVRNHGDSPHSDDHTYPALASDVCALLTEERIPQVVGLGHSSGGRILMYLALTFPELVERLIIVDISPVSQSKNTIHIKKYMEVMSAFELPPKINVSIARTLVDEALKPVVSDKNVRTFMLTNLVKKSDGTIGWRANLPGLIQNFSNIMKFPIEPNSGIQYSGPTTFIAGENSDHLESKDHGEIQKLFPNAIFITVPGAGHLVHTDKPKMFIQLIQNALQ